MRGFPFYVLLKEAGDDKKAARRLLCFAFSLLAEGGFGGRDQPGEGFRIVDGDLGEHLAVHLDAGLLEAAHEDGIADAVDAASSVDALDPELTIIPLDEATGIVSVTERVANLLFGGLEEKVLRAEVAFCALQDFFATGTGNGATFNSSHFLFLLI